MTYTGAQQRYMKKDTKKGQTNTPFVNMPFPMKKGSGSKSHSRRSSHRRAR